jgi:hypothetical protein
LPYREIYAHSRSDTVMGFLILQSSFSLLFLGDTRMQRYFSVVIALLVLFVCSGCERYEQKSQAKERRRDYMQNYLDSARKASDRKKDSLRLVQDSTKK